MTIPTMVSIKEASSRTGLSYDYIRKLCLQKKIVFVKAGSKYLINLEKLVIFLNDGE
ncbi:excisionase family DNA-binding protein [Blautia sp. HCP3S3_D9]|uniref:excisionase family DNA-binding protein n=1 Tax=unclassified Blautia TaxID=2648079 RepID=UPI002A7FBD77|nr:excisionase family DNA-binding protein [Blautia sp.]MDY4115124.1 excisionase family DNA-binding protein [Blautia sp.]